MSGIDDDPTQPDADRPLFEPDAADLPRVVGNRYTLEERLGIGGGAVVWRAFDEGLNRTVAVKLLRPRRDDGDDPAARLRREAATAGRVPHPGIVAVYDTGVDDDLAWLALEHVDGPTLLDVLRHHPRGLPPQAAAAIAEQVAVALGHAHTNGLVHRDVKPSNLLLTGDGVVKLADFGVAATAGSRTAELAGSRAYAPPEQLDGGDGDDEPTVDVFALGVVLHECLTGRPAFAGPRRRSRGGDELLAPRQIRPDVPRDLDEVVRRATRTDPRDRFADGTAMATALRPLVASDPLELTRALVRDRHRGAPVAASPDDQEARPEAARPPAARERADWRWVAVGLAVLVAAAVLTAVAVRGGGGPAAGPTPLADIGVPVTDVAVFDPYGAIGDGTRPAAAVDGDDATAWRTPAYPVPLRSLGTPGVGVWIDVGAPRTIEAVEVQLATPGVTIELLAGDEAPRAGTSEADWRSLDRAVRPGVRADLTADGETARYWLLWITELEPVGETWQAAVTDLRFRPAGTS